MSDRELRDRAEARRFLAQGLWLQRATPPRAATVRPALGWLMELAAGGEPLPPVALVGDVGHLTLGRDREDWGARELPAVPGWPAGTLRAYEDHVLGRLDADRTIARAADALARYEGRDRSRGLAFVLDRLRRRAKFGGVLLNPAAIKGLIEAEPEGVLAEGWESLERDGPMPVLRELTDGLVAAARDMAEALGPEDVFELEHGTALAPFAQRVGLRQVLRAAADFEAAAPTERPRRSGRRHEVPTRVLDEDTYPVGGFSSISTRGSIESLLHSQLAFMERDERPDLFDIKYVRDELLYYARDENQFLRRRRTFLFALAPDLAEARVKDAGLPVQRIVLLLGFLVAAVRTLTAWLGEDALTFEFLFPEGNDGDALAAERALLEMVLREPIALGMASIQPLPPAAPALADRCTARARRSLCHCLTMAAGEPPSPAAEGTSVARLRLDGPCPAIGFDANAPSRVEAGDPAEGWRVALASFLEEWA